MDSNITVKQVQKLKTVDQVIYSLGLVFQECQASLGTHKRLLAVLQALLAKSLTLDALENFSEAFCDIINRALPVKKGQTAVDRIFRLIGSFVEAIEKDSQDEMDQDDEKADPVAVLTDTMIRHLLQGTSAKDKVVRFRVFQLISIIVHHMSSINNELYELLTEHASSRLRDREATVRIQAVSCMAMFQGSVDEEDENESLVDPSKLILESMENDPSPEVRRIALMHIQKTEQLKSRIIMRARDENQAVRKFFYTTVVKQLLQQVKLDAETRNDILSWGLNDREESVRLAAEKLFCYDWLESVNGNVMELLERLHVTTSSVAETAIKCFLSNRADIVIKIDFSEQFWQNLTPETALFSKVYYDYCTEKNMEESIDKNFPEAVELAKLLQKYMNLRLDNQKLIEGREADPGEGVSDIPMDANEVDYVIEQLLKLAINYDLSDEVGRREILQVLRLSLSEHMLTDNQVESLIQVIKKISINERDFCQMLVEIVADIRDSHLEDDDFDATFHSAVSEMPNRSLEKQDEEDVPSQQSKQPILADPRQTAVESLKEVPTEAVKYILIIIKCMLGSLEKEEDRISLNSLMATVVEPFFESEDEKVAELALYCIGLRAVLNEEYAIKAAFYDSVAISHRHLEMRAIALKSLTDIIAVHGTSSIVLQPGEVPQTDSMKVITEVSLARTYYRTLRDDTKPELQAIAGESIFKLFLADVLTDDELFETTLLAWYNPTVNANETLKQCLAFCIPTYSYSHLNHQQRMCRVAGDAIRRTFLNWEENKDGIKPTTDVTTVLHQFTAWTDPSRVVNISKPDLESSTNHILYVTNVLKAVCSEERLYTNQKYLVPTLTALSKIYIGKSVVQNRLVDLLRAVEMMESEFLEGTKAYTKPAKTAVSVFVSRLQALIGEEALNAKDDADEDEESDPGSFDLEAEAQSEQDSNTSVEKEDIAESGEEEGELEDEESRD